MVSKDGRECSGRENVYKMEEGERV